MYREILLATDGSDEAKRALEVAIDLATQYDGRVHVVSVGNAGRLKAMSPDLEGAFDRVESEAQTRIDETLSGVDTGDVEIVEAPSVGAPVDRIVEYARERDVDLVVVGTRGRDSVGDRLIGSVSERVVRRAPVSVHVVR